MEFFDHLQTGFSTAVSLQNLLYCFAGVTLGTLIGVLPGIGPAATVAMLLPLTFNLDAVSSLIMLSGIYYGAQYGGSTTAILINLPGESSAVVTALDGHQMARQGRAGPALVTAALGSFFAGTVATLLLAVLSPPLSQLALTFTSADYFALMVVGLVGAVALAKGSVINALGMVVIGLLLGTTGQDIYTGLQRFTFGHLELVDGIDFVAVAMGMFGLAEIIRNLEGRGLQQPAMRDAGRLWITRQDLKAIIMPVIRGTGLGSVLGALPGGGGTLSSFASYALEKKLARDPSRFGKGAIEGVAGPESANNAGAQTSFIPMLTLGIPSNPTMALMVGALIIQGISPGPNVISEQPVLFWGVIASMWIGNLMLVVLNLPLVGLWVKLLQVPYKVLFPGIVAFCCIGVYSLNNSSLDIYLMVIAGLAGYVFSKLDCEPAPLLLGLILGPMLEEHFRRALLYSRGDFTVFVTNPVSGGLLLVALVALVSVILPAVRSRREEAFKEDA